MQQLFNLLKITKKLSITIWWNNLKHYEDKGWEKVNQTIMHLFWIFFVEKSEQGIYDAVSV